MFKYTVAYTAQNNKFGVVFNAKVHKRNICTIDTGIRTLSNSKAKECEENIQSLLNAYKQLKGAIIWNANNQYAVILQYLNLIQKKNSGHTNKNMQTYSAS